ncbi:MAG: hypothetical protein ABIK62_02365 [candidate division WOR-3 bacterium]
MDSKQFMPIEEVLKVCGNRYAALNIAAQEVRRMIEAASKGEAQLPGSPYYHSLRRLVDGEIEYETGEDDGKSET